MPLSIPAFVQYQSPLIPLRGLWNAAPKEGDFFVNCEVDWLVSPPGGAVQFSFSGNSPVNLSQIVALAVDNGRCGSDVDFIFPDSGWKLTVPAHSQVVAPVFTNALMFYVAGSHAAIGDTTVFQVFNSMPPPVQIATTSGQNSAAVSGIPVSNGTYGVINPPTSGTLNTISLNVLDSSGAASAMQVNLIDGTPRNLWVGFFEVAANGSQFVNVTGLALRFTGGVQVVVSNSTFTTGEIIANLYYTAP